MADNVGSFKPIKPVIGEHLGIPLWAHDNGIGSSMVLGFMSDEFIAISVIQKTGKTSTMVIDKAARDDLISLLASHDKGTVQ